MVDRQAIDMMAFEPFMIHCFRVVESVCFSQALRCSGGAQKEANGEFSEFLQRHYVPFLKNSLRCMFFCGFVPWRKYKLQSGDWVPECIPLGSFQWNVRINQKEKSRNAPLMEYEILSCQCSVSIKDIHIYQTSAPVYSRNASLCISPMSSVVERYNEFTENMRNVAQIDEWNSRAQVVTEKSKKVRINGGDSGEGTRTRSEVIRRYADDDDDDDIRINAWNYEITDRNNQIYSSMSQNNVNPPMNIYHMPTDVVSRQLAPITLTGNIEQYMYRYQISVCNLLGVPPDMVMSTPLLGNGDKPNGSYTMSSRVFSNNMRNLCNVLQTLAEQVYETIYDTDNVKMLLSTVPKLEIQNFDDLEKTVRSGAMSTEILELIARSLALDFGCVVPYIPLQCSCLCYIFLLCSLSYLLQNCLMSRN